MATTIYHRNEDDVMNAGVQVIKALSKLFPKPLHPFNMSNDGKKSYAEWQYDKGEKTIDFYLEHFSTKEMFKGKTVLDMGCGAAGKTLYYAGLGAKKIVGTDIVPSYKAESEKLAQKLGYQDIFSFVLGDATSLPFESETFDTIMMNDFMEHIDNPTAALAEAFRLLRPRGRIYINFPPYYHPFGAHLSDAINIPWVHLFFSDKTLINAYRQMISSLPDAQSRIDLRISEDKYGDDYFSYVNKMTIKKFRKLLLEIQLSPIYYKETPLRWYLKQLAISPLKEFFVRMVVCVLEKPDL